MNFGSYRDDKFWIMHTIGTYKEIDCDKSTLLVDLRSQRKREYVWGPTWIWHQSDFCTSIHVERRVEVEYGVWLSWMHEVVAAEVELFLGADLFFEFVERDARANTKHHPLIMR